MGIVIVTQNQYILAKSIHTVTLNEEISYADIRTSTGRHRSIKQFSFNINILYVPETATHNNGSMGRGDDVRECTIHLVGKVNAHKVYRDLIQQMREQCPDQLFLDKALENLLSPDTLAEIAASETNDIMKAEKETKDDRSSKKIRRIGKAKKPRKGVLRKAKTSNRRGR